jgi:hypothetical protein
MSRISSTPAIRAAPNKAPIPSEQGTDHVEFVKIDGQWKIKKRVLVTYAYVPRESLMEKQKT